MTLSLCMIVKDEAECIDECLRSVEKYVDEIVIVDTGSSDDTKARCLAHGAKVFDFNPETNPEAFFRDEGPPPQSGRWCLGDFSAARNFSFSKATSDFIMWLDADDTLEGGKFLRAGNGIPGLVDHLCEDHNGRQRFAALMYDYSSDANGNVTCSMWRERIVPRGVGLWSGVVHEFIGGLDWRTVVKHHSIKVVHHWRPRRGGVVNRNYKILLRAVDKNPDPDARTLFYLGNEARHLDKAKALWAYGLYVQKSHWPEERALAHVRMGEIYEGSISDLPAAKREFAVAAADADLPEGWFGLARIAYLRALKTSARRDWEDCVKHSESGFKSIPAHSDSILMHNPVERGQKPHVYYNRALYYVGRVEDALASCEAGLRLGPETHLASNKAFYECELKGTQKPAPRIEASFKKHLDIVVWTGPALEPWGPQSRFKGGIGGAETACIGMCTGLAKLGHKVIVYSDCQDDGGLHHVGDAIIEYVNYKQLVKPAACDVFISSRQQDAIYKVQARATFLWMHDSHIGTATPAMMCYDRVLALSKWHKDFIHKVYLGLTEDRVLVTRNGIDASLFQGDLPPKKNHLVWSSAVNRGLDGMLDMMPAIQKVVPDAELHVYYGFEASKLQLEFAKDKQGLLKLEECRRRAHEMPGVVVHGRVGQQVLASAMMASKLWVYPTACHETFCIGALEAQAAGCVPVATRLAGLAETVKFGVLIDHRPYGDYAFQHDFVEAACGLLIDEERRGYVAFQGRKWALTQTWDSVAVEWDTLFRTVLGG